MRPCTAGNHIGKCLYIIAAAPWVNLLGDHGLFLDINLGIACYTCREIGRKRNGLIKRIRVKRLCMSKRRAHCLDTCTADIVERILLGKRPSRCLGVCTQCERFWVLWIELLDNLCPKHTRRTHLCHLHKIVHADSPEERKARGKGVNVDTGVDSGTQIFQAVSKRVSQLNIAGCASLLHMVARNGYRVELGHVLRSVLKYVGNDTH